MNIDHLFFQNRRRNYLHFDYPLKSEQVFTYVTNSKNIEKHAFYPFIHFELHSQKIKKTGFKIVEGRKKFIVEKQSKKVRPIKYSSHIDGHIYAYYAHILSVNYEKILYEKNLSESVLAFRKLPNSPNNIDFAKNVFVEVKQRQNCSVICLDIKSFFDDLDHIILKKAWLKILELDHLPKDHFQVFKSITKYSYVYKKPLYERLNLSLNKSHKGLKRLCSNQEFREKIKTQKIILKNPYNKGIPQGSSISAFLSNIYMLDFDQIMAAKINKLGGKYYRYCDDILIICDTADKNSLLLFAQNSIKKLKLVIQDTKTKIPDFRQGICVSKDKLQYLGFIYDGEKVLLRDSGLAQYSKKTNKAIRMTNKKLIKINYARLSKGLEPVQRHHKHIYRRFSFIGQRNYISYALRAARIMQEPAIKKQIKPHWKKLKDKLKYYDQFNEEIYQLFSENS